MIVFDDIENAFFVLDASDHKRYIIHTLSIVADLANIRYEQNTDFHLRLFIIILYRMFPSQKRARFKSLIIREDISALEFAVTHGMFAFSRRNCPNETLII